MKKKVTLENVEASLARWRTRMKRAVTMIDKLERQRKRLDKAARIEAVRRDELAIVPAPVARPPVAPKPGPVLPAPEIDTAIPGFLRRDKDPVAEEIREQQAETKRRKAQGRIAKLKAKQSGETRKMPLTGRAALDAIRNG
jgi:hypothetical protein